MPPYYNIRVVFFNFTIIWYVQKKFSHFCNIMEWKNGRSQKSCKIKKSGVSCPSTTNNLKDTLNTHVYLRKKKNWDVHMWLVKTTRKNTMYWNGREWNEWGDQQNQMLVVNIIIYWSQFFFFAWKASKFHDSSGLYFEYVKKKQLTFRFISTTQQNLGQFFFFEGDGMKCSAEWPFHLIVTNLWQINPENCFKFTHCAVL